MCFTWHWISLIKKISHLNYEQQWNAVNQTQAIAEFDKEGMISYANPDLP